MVMNRLLLPYTLQQTLHIPVIKAVRVNAQTDWAEIARHIDQLAGVLLIRTARVMAGQDMVLIGTAFRKNCVGVSF